MWMEITYSQGSDESSIISAISTLYLPELEQLGMITEPTAGERSLAREEEDQEQGLQLKHSEQMHSPTGASQRGHFHLWQF